MKESTLLCVNDLTMTSNMATSNSEEVQESVTEIQTYLETFNKEIEEGEEDQLQHVQLQQVEGLSGGEEGGTYFVDQSGYYYYQANNGETPVIAQVQIQEVQQVNIQNEKGVPEEEQYHESGKLRNVVGNENGQVTSNGNNEIVINSGDAYQTVTIVPSDTNPGEVSYVLIVQQPNIGDKESNPIKQGGTKDYKGGEEQALTVYNFKNNENNEAPVELVAEDDITSIIKFLPKKSETVTQAHVCNYCNYTSTKRYLLSRHMKSHSQDRPHKCNVCERGFKTLPSLQNHMNTHTGTKPHRCKSCDSTFTTSGELVRHVRYKHTHEKPHKCRDCDYASVELSKLKRHVRRHTGERPHQCPHCTYASPDTFKLKRHMRTHTGEKPYQCDICHTRFTQACSLKTHKLIHSIADKPVFQCELCPTTCGRKTDLRIHVQNLHATGEPVKCKRCGKSFPDRYSYKVHLKNHEGKRCYKCILCPYASVSERHLEKHMLIHTKRKVYQCDYCFQSFKQKQHLKRHCKLYHNPPPYHKCLECERSFRHKGNLIRHMAVHDPESSLQEKQQALKVGRQEKIQIKGDKDEKEDKEDTMAVEGNDDQQYVVLDVIQLSDNQGADQQMTVVASEDGDLVIPDPLSQEREILNGKSSSQHIQNDSKFEEKMETCFDFEEEKKEQEEAIANIDILQTIL